VFDDFSHRISFVCSPFSFDHSPFTDLLCCCSCSDSTDTHFLALRAFLVYTISIRYSLICCSTFYVLISFRYHCISISYVYFPTLFEIFLRFYVPPFTFWSLCISSLSMVLVFGPDVYSSIHSVPICCALTVDSHSISFYLFILSDTFTFFIHSGPDTVRSYAPHSHLPFVVTFIPSFLRYVVLHSYIVPSFI